MQTARIAKTSRIAKMSLYHVCILLFGCVMLYPVAWMIMGSFKTNVEILNDSLNFLPKSFSLANYRNGWAGFGGISFGVFFKNSLIVSALSTLGTTLSSALIAYGFARLRFPGKRIWFLCMMVTMMLPGQVMLIPQYIIYLKLGWINTFYPLVVPEYGGKAFFIFMIMQFIQGLPKELDEAATIDGCSVYSIFPRITLPLITPALVTTIVISFYWKWDDFLGPLLYLSRVTKFTVSVAIKAFADASSTTDYGAMFAMSTLSLLPVFFIFLFFNRLLIEGISTSGLKG